MKLCKLIQNKNNSRHELRLLADDIDDSNAIDYEFLTIALDVCTYRYICIDIYKFYINIRYFFNVLVQRNFSNN